MGAGGGGRLAAALLWSRPGRRLGLGLCLVLTACGDAGPAPSEARLAAAELLAFVPAGEAQLPEFSGTFRAGSARPLLVDRFEVRAGDFLPEGDQDPALAPELPASCTWQAATAYAAATGMRLPTAAEWMYVATGRLGHAYPWGRRRRSVANTLELGLSRTVAVGTFESGRGPFGTYDQIGNVWEWVSDYVPGYDAGGGPEAGLPEGPRPGLRSALGGSYRTRLRPLFPTGGGPPVFAVGLTVEHRADDLGFRRVVDAEQWLRRELPGLDPEDAAQRQRLVELGAEWHRHGEVQLEKLLRELAAELAGQPGAAALAALLEGAGA